jgi:hypothetical protein
MKSTCPYACLQIYWIGFIGSNYFGFSRKALK